MLAHTLDHLLADEDSLDPIGDELEQHNQYLNRCRRVQIVRQLLKCVRSAYFDGNPGDDHRLSLRGSPLEGAVDQHVTSNRQDGIDEDGLGAIGDGEHHSQEDPQADQRLPLAKVDANEGQYVRNGVAEHLAGLVGCLGHLDCKSAANALHSAQHQDTAHHRQRDEYAKQPGMMRHRHAADELQVLHSKNDQQRSVAADEDEQRGPQTQPERRVRRIHVSRHSHSSSVTSSTLCVNWLSSSSIRASRFA